MFLFITKEIITLYPPRTDILCVNVSTYTIEILKSHETPVKLNRILIGPILNTDMVIISVR